MGWSGAGTVVRTDGTRTGENVWADARDAGEAILAEDHDIHDEDLANAIEAALNINGENAMAAALDMGDNQVQNLTSGSALHHAVAVRQIQHGKLTWAGTSGGSANLQTLTLSPGISAYENGMAIGFLAGFTNTGSVDVNVNGKGDVSLFDWAGNALMAGAIVAGNYYEIRKTGTNFRIRNPETKILITVPAPAATEYTLTGISPSAKKITIIPDALSLNAVEDLWVRIGSGGGIQTSGYTSLCTALQATGNTLSNESTAFMVADELTNGVSLQGEISLTLADAANHTWVSAGNLISGGAKQHMSAGRKALASRLDRVQVLTESVSVFDAGDIVFLIEM